MSTRGMKVIRKDTFEAIITYFTELKINFLRTNTIANSFVFFFVYIFTHAYFIHIYPY